MKDEGLPSDAVKYEEYARNVDSELSIIRDLILNGYASKRQAAAD
jgi:two-component system, chemotaxis family, protein-glutamate methylesterase/glutaminase